MKILRAGREDARLRFATEGHLLRNFGGRHHLVRCDAVLADPPSLVHELVGPESLRDRLRTGPLPLRLALACLRQAADALGWLHQHGVYHRDLKPSNILLADDGTWRVIDLSVAAHGDPPRGLPDGWIEEEIGTAGYAAPELLARPDTATPAIDVYSLGVVLYETLSGRWPGELAPGETDRQYRARAATGPEPVGLRLRGDYPPAVVRTVMRAVDPDPAARFASVADLVGALGGLG